MTGPMSQLNLFRSPWAGLDRPAGGAPASEPDVDPDALDWSEVWPARTYPRPAAGLLLRYTDEHGPWYLLGKRCARLGGTWANLGGSLEPDEHPIAGAAREFSEELGLPVTRLVGATIARVIESGDEMVPYTLFVLDVPAPFYDADLSWENDELAWFLPAHIDHLDLHAGFARAWATLQETP